MTKKEENGDLPLHVCFPWESEKKKENKKHKRNMLTGYGILADKLITIHHLVVPDNHVSGMHKANAMRHLAKSYEVMVCSYLLC